MGYRPYILEHYEVKHSSALLGFNYGTDKFDNLLSKVKVDNYSGDGYNEIDTNQLLSIPQAILDTLDEVELNAILRLQDSAQKTNYSQCGYLRIEWF